jgi:anti-anti-sigma regulatory factor
MDDNKIWIFPKSINIEEVSEYVERLKNLKNGEIVTFDLSKTVNIHSSFIGFLIHAKHHIRKNGGRLILLLSLTVEKILIMLNIIEYFSPEIETSINKKTA